MKVGLYSGTFSPEEGGGYTIEKEMVEAIRRNLAATQHHFVLYSFHQSAQALRLPRFEVLPLHSPLTARALHKGRQWLQAMGLGTAGPGPLQKIILDNQPDLLFYLSPWENFGVDVPYLTIVWDLQHRLQPFFPEVSAGGEWHKRERNYHRNLSRATYVITGNQAGQREIEHFYNIAPQRIRHLPHPTPSFALQQRDTLPLPERCRPKRPFLFYPAQFWPHKNHVGLLKTLHLLVTQHGLDLELVLSGSDKGNQAHIKEVAAQLQILDRVHFAGFVSIAELIAFYQHALALVYPTFFGPENLPPLEAFALGCPVVASSVEGAEIQLADAALLADPRQPEAIAQAVAQLYHSPTLRQSMIQKGKAIAQERSGDAFALKFFAILDEFAVYRQCWK